jgi:hypothetical protein
MVSLFEEMDNCGLGGHTGGEGKASLATFQYRNGILQGFAGRIPRP